MANMCIKNAEKIYPGNVTALKGIDLEISDGELVVLVGPSGCVILPPFHRTLRRLRFELR